MGNDSRKYLSLIILAGMLLLLIPPVIGETFSDGFNNNAINSSFWIVKTTGEGPTLSETNQQLEINFPSNSVESGEGSFGAGLVTA